MLIFVSFCMTPEYKRMWNPGEGTGSFGAGVVGSFECGSLQVAAGNRIWVFRKNCTPLNC